MEGKRWPRMAPACETEQCACIRNAQTQSSALSKSLERTRFFRVCVSSCGFAHSRFRKCCRKSCGAWEAPPQRGQSERFAGGDPERRRRRVTGAMASCLWSPSSPPPPPASVELSASKNLFSTPPPPDSTAVLAHPNFGQVRSPASRGPGQAVCEGRGHTKGHTPPCCTLAEKHKIAPWSPSLVLIPSK